MIICDEQEFVFVHIPKCGGTSMRQMLSDFDSTNGRCFSRVDVHPVLGKIDYIHLPLTVLQEYFPVEFDKLTAYKSFALIRNPTERFVSALAHWTKNIHQKRLLELQIDELRHYTVAILDTLEKDGFGLAPELIHFRPQVDFVYMNGSQIVGKLFNLTELEKLLPTIERHLSIDLPDMQRSNQMDHYRNTIIKNLAEAVGPANRLVRKVLPQNSKRVLRKLLFKPVEGARKIAGTEMTVEDVIGESSLNKRIQKIYRSDIELWELVQKNNGVVG